MLSRLCPGLLLLCCRLALPAHAGSAQLVSYVSSLDNSTQQYGIYLPTQPAPTPAGYPAIFHLHGYGWSVSTNFSDFQKQWAERHGWILVNLNARGPQFYEGVGDIESHNVIRDANRRFGLDLARLFITGGSMGGTGAFRLGLRYPNVFAAAVGVDGWSDFREWHKHWYARTDQIGDIEEFRRPLLEAASPLYWTGRSRWGQVQASVSGKDSVVLPENGLSLYNALVERANNMPGAYESRLFFDEAAGHGGSTRIDQIYAFFAHRAALAEPQSFLCESTLLTHGNLYWGSMERQIVPGAYSALESDTAANTVTALTRNLSGLALHLQASPVADQKTVNVWVDGFPCYSGPPKTLHLQADLSPAGGLWGWHESEAEGRRKTPLLEGPLGEAFKVPFVVVYGTAGSAAETDRNRREATDFATGWNAFMVHAEAVLPLPEDRLAAPDLQSRSLVLFGTEGSSALLQRAQAAFNLPVRVQSDRIRVRDPQWGEREYLGAQFGAFFCTPNPLSDFRTYLVVLRGQFATKPDGTIWRGLEYDLEKLPWAYPDYVVFNSDQSQLPHVLNVNDKPPVTCYEAGYFVEAGYFDQDWQPCRTLTLDRLNALKLGTRRCSVAAVNREADGVQVRVVDGTGAPVKQARVTVRLTGQQLRSQSAVSTEAGVALFPCGPGEDCTVQNVMATGAEYDFTADLARSTTERGLGLSVSAGGTEESGQATVWATVSAPCDATVVLTPLVPGGQVLPPQATVALTPGQPRRVSFVWDSGDLPAGSYNAELTLRCAQPRVQFSRPLVLKVGRFAVGDLRVSEVKPVDLTAGSPWQVTARLLNVGDKPLTVPVYCALPEDRIYLPPKKVTVRPHEELAVTFAPRPTETPLPVGMHTVRVCVPGLFGVTGSADFSVK